MIVRQRGSVSAVIAFVLALLLIGVAVLAGFLWLQEADKRLQAEQKLEAVQQKYDELKTQCDAMKTGGQIQGVTLETEQNPVVAGLESQTDVPQCESPTVQKFTEPMRVQDPDFFASAKKGDMLVTYQLSKMAYLYRPSNGAIVNQARIAGPTSGI